MSTTDIAREITASPRFQNDTGKYFDEVAARYGHDVAGVAWIQACLMADQDTQA